MTSFKRKRIEKWCEDVSQYLKNGTICRSVIGNVAEDAICGGVSVPATGSIDDNANGNDNDGSGNLTSKVDVALTKAAQTLASNDLLQNRENLTSNDGNAIPSQSSALPGHSSFPTVKFAYSHYHEQRRKIDRLVQGLPVLTANGLSTLERPSSKTSTDEHVPIIIVSGEEPVRSSHPRSRSSSQPKRDRTHYPAAGGHRASPLTASSNSNAQHQLRHHNHHHRNPLEASIPTNNSFRHPAHPPSSPLRRNGSGNGNNNAGGKLYDLGRSPNFHVGVTVDPGLSLTANDRIARIKTAPVPNRNLHRARQRILTRRGNRVLESTSQIPLQSCWAMAEMTW